MSLVGAIPLLESSVAPSERVGTSVIPSACFTAGSPGDPGTSQGSQKGAEREVSWAGSLLQRRAGILGWRELKEKQDKQGSAAERQLCPGAAALQSPAGLRALPAGTEGRGERG